ncbi:MAG: hydrogenase maturation protease [Clostridia bacterium]|jgi:hydrogenase maturation protease|nr:hydrogenase maturation protease [Clostridia bacterium]MDD4572138.1 hydrogenase maturation protease [Clostridia bacterium]
MKRIVVFGIGNLIMQDDGIGVRVVKAIQKDLTAHDIITIIGETDFQYCFEQILSDDFIFIIDAMYQNKNPGNIQVIPLHEALKNHTKLRTQHEFSLLDSIALHYPNIQGYIIGIEVLEIGFSSELSKFLNSCFNQTCINILNSILKLTKKAADKYVYCDPCQSDSY